MRSFSILGAAVISLFFGPSAWAACCNLSKIDPETPLTLVRACEPTLASCQTVIFEGTLAIGDSVNVCVSETEVVYQEYDDVLGSFGPETVAVCDGGDVEI